MATIKIAEVDDGDSRFSYEVYVENDAHAAYSARFTSYSTARVYALALEAPYGHLLDTSEEA